MRRLITIALSLATATAAEPEADPDELPRLAPTEPADALSTFEISPGFRLELAAHEPMVVDPIAMAFDGPGRMFVAEMRGYSERRDDRLGRVRLLVDDDGDGRFDRSSVFAEGLAWPTGVIAWEGGVFVLATPDLLYFGDGDGDGVSDSREVVFTGFASGAKRLNVQAQPNSLQWGPDGRVHGATAANAGEVGVPGADKTIDLRGVDFSFHPGKRDLRAEHGGGQYGMGFDSWGRKFVCSNSDHIQQVVYPRRYAGGGLPSPRVSIAADGPAAEVFRRSPDEPWRVVRTRWRVGGLVGGPVEGGGRVSGYFTSATGIAIWRGQAFIGDVGSNLVHRKVLDDAGVQLVARRHPGELDREFLSSTDNWFRPVQMMPGPDGALYIADMYREVIEHPWSIPESIKKHLDLNSGNDRGRIYRIVATGDSPPLAKPVPPDLGQIARFERTGEGDRARLASLVDHESAQVRFQLALTLGQMEGDWRVAPLVELLAGAGEDRWLRAAALRALGGASPVQVVESALGTKPDAATYLALAKFASRSGNAEAVALVWESAPEDVRFRVAEALDKDDFGEELAREAMGLLYDHGSVSPERLAVVRTAVRRGGDDPPLSLLLRDPPEPAAVQRAIIETLMSRDSDRAIADTVARSLPRLDPSVRSLAAGWMAADAVRARIMLEKASPVLIDAAAAERLRDSPDKAVRALAAEVLPALPATARELERLAPALSAKGDPARGRAHYAARCATCHRAADRSGIAFGPDVTSFRNSGPEAILTNIVDPGRELPPQYSTHRVDLKSGEQWTGLLLGRDGREVRLRLVGGVERSFATSEVAGVTDLGLSLMPAGLTSGLSPEDVADLLAFLSD